MIPATQDQPAPAAKEVEGKIKSLSRSVKSLTLEDGTKLVIPASIKVERGALRLGAVVKVMCEEKDGQKVVTAIEVRQGGTGPKS